MKANAIRCFVLSMVLLTYSAISMAYSKAVHERITDEAIQQNLTKIDKSINDYTGIIGVDSRINGKTIRRWIEDGSWMEDLGLDILTSHFYNPLTNKGLTEMGVEIDESAYDRANNPSNSMSWKYTRSTFYSGLTAKTKADRDLFLSFSFFALGHSLHLVQDVAVPAHVRNDVHIPRIDPETYEDYAERNREFLKYTLVSFPYWNVSISPAAPKQFWDFDSYNGSVPYTSGYIGLAEYTNANFFSKDTIFKDFPHPKKENTTATLVEQYAKDGKKDQVWYIQGYTSQRLAAYSYFNKWLLPDRWEYNLDGFVYEDYASKLIPRAVGYSAGLLNYFFRGELDMAPDEATGSGYVIVNNTDEDMSGTFELWYDNKNDERVKVSGASWTLSINKKSSGNNKSTNITFTPPTNAKEPDKYMLAFRGKLGNEEDAVVGKEVMLLPPLVFLIYQDAQNNPVYAVWSMENNGKKLVNYNFDISKYATYFNIYSYRNPSVVKSDGKYRNHRYTIENGGICGKPQYGKQCEYSPVLIGVKHCFKGDIFDSGYTWYGQDAICYGRNSS